MVSVTDTLDRMKGALTSPLPVQPTPFQAFLIVGLISVAVVAWRQVINYIGYKD